MYEKCFPRKYLYFPRGIGLLFYNFRLSSIQQMPVLRRSHNKLLKKITFTFLNSDQIRYQHIIKWKFLLLMLHIKMHKHSLNIVYSKQYILRNNKNADTF